MKSYAFGLALTLASGCACAASSDFGALGLYIGGAAGQSNLQGDLLSFSSDCGPSSCAVALRPLRFSRHATGWEAIAGLRPWPLFGAEAEYIDFGSTGTTQVFRNSTANELGVWLDGTAHPTAAALFAVGYLPMALPHLDVFAKVGMAKLRIHDNFSGELGCGEQPGCDPLDSLQSSERGTHARPAYGAGLQGVSWIL